MQEGGLNLGFEPSLYGKVPLPGKPFFIFRIAFMLPEPAQKSPRLRSPFQFLQAQ